MDSPTDTSLLESALPPGFAFYHLGEVLRSESANRNVQELFDGRNVAAFQFQGDIRGALLISFEAALDRDTYLEFGNVLASRFATALSDRDGLDVMISPPRMIDSGDSMLIARLLGSENVIQHSYILSQGDRKIPVWAVVAVSAVNGQEGRLDV